MAGVLQHLRSSTLNKRPNPASMVDGQIAINYASGAPGMFFKDSNGSLVKVGPVHVGSGAPNAVPASGGTAGNSIGEQWLDTSGGTYVFKIWDGSAWRSEAGEFVNVTGDTMTGALGIIAGSASSPSLFISGDSNTGIYSPGADQVAISTGGTGRLFVDASGRVGVGASAPDTILHVSGIDGALKLQGTRGTGASATISTGGTNSQNLIITASTDLYLRGTQQLFQNLAGTTEYMRLDSSGRVGIGTTGPGKLLAVEGSTTPGISVKTTLASSYSTNEAINDANDYIQLFANGSTRAAFGALDTGETALLSSKSVSIMAANSNQVIKFATGGSTERARIDSSGRLLVGTSSTLGQNELVQIVKSDAGDHLGIFSFDATAGGQPAEINLSRSKSDTKGTGVALAADDLIGGINFRGYDGDNYSLAASIVALADGEFNTSGDTTDSPGRLVFSTTADGASSPTERLRITSNGRAVFGGIATTTGSTTSNILVGTSNSPTGAVGIEGYTSITTERFHASFVNGNGVVGSISTNGSATAFNTSSDYRLKENVVPLTGAADRVNQLQVRRFNFIADPDTTVDGFIAHEAQAVVPEAVRGTKDEVDADGNPVYQGIDQSKLVPLLTAALQEALAKIEVLEQRLTDAGIA